MSGSLASTNANRTRRYRAHRPRPIPEHQARAVGMLCAWLTRHWFQIFVILTAAWGAESRAVLLRSIPKILLQPRFRAVVLFRLSQFAWRRTYSRVFAHWLLAN